MPFTRWHFFLPHYTCRQHTRRWHRDGLFIDWSILLHENKVPCRFAATKAVECAWGEEASSSSTSSPSSSPVLFFPSFLVWWTAGGGWHFSLANATSTCFKPTTFLGVVRTRERHAHQLLSGLHFALPLHNALLISFTTCLYLKGITAPVFSQSALNKR